MVDLNARYTVKQNLFPKYSSFWLLSVAKGYKCVSRMTSYYFNEVKFCYGTPQVIRMYKNTWRPLYKIDTLIFRTTNKKINTNGYIRKSSKRVDNVKENIPKLLSCKRKLSG